MIRCSLIQQKTITKKGMNIKNHALRSKSYEDMLHISITHAPEMIIKIIIMNITRDIIIRRMCKKMSAYRRRIL